MSWSLKSVPINRSDIFCTPFVTRELLNATLCDKLIRQIFSEAIALDDLLMRR
jgi:hypothetical protein